MKVFYTATSYSLTSCNNLWELALRHEWDEHQPGTLNTRGTGIQRVHNDPDATPSGVIYTSRWGRIEGWINGLSAYVVAEN